MPSVNCLFKQELVSIGIAIKQPLVTVDPQELKIGPLRAPVSTIFSAWGWCLGALGGSTQASDPAPTFPIGGVLLKAPSLSKSVYA